MMRGDEDDEVNTIDQGDPKNPPEATPGALCPIEADDLPTSKELGGD